jgi:hypothetical protein
VVNWHNSREKSKKLEFVMSLQDYFHACLSFSYMISALFTRASVAAMAGVLIYMMGYLPWTFYEALGLDGIYGEAYIFVSEKSVMRSNRCFVDEGHIAQRVEIQLILLYLQIMLYT